VNKRLLAELADLPASTPARLQPPPPKANAGSPLLGGNPERPVGSIGRADDFFLLGGTSLAAVRLVVTLDRRSHSAS